MLARSQRLSRTEFSQFFATGKRIHTECVTIIFSPFPSLHGSVVVSKKVARSAVRRNTLRRRVYAQLRVVGQQYPGVYILILKPTFAQLTQKQAALSIKAALNKITHTHVT